VSHIQKIYNIKIYNMAEKEEPILLDSTTSAQVKTTNSMMQTTVGRVALYFSCFVCIIVALLALKSGNFFVFLNAVSK